MKLSTIVLAATASLLVPSLAVADQVTEWNDTVLQAIRDARTPPPPATRNMAILHIALHDAASSLDGRYATYLDHGTPPAGASIAAAIAAAGHTALDALYPGVADAVYDAQLAAIPDGQAKNDGIAWGATVGQACFDDRADDGANMVVAYASPAGAWWWIPTPPAFAPALLPQWPYLRTWAMPHGATYRAPGPPGTPSGHAYLVAYEEVRKLGRATGSQRTAEQSEIAQFWNDGAGTQTPPGHWMEIAGDLVESHNLDLVDSARVMALVAITVADAAIISWDSKYHYHHWRPVTAIQNADSDANPATVADPAWTSFIATPPFPTYTSGHSTFSGSAGRMLGHLFGDATAFTIGSDGLPGVTRSFDSLSQASEEAGQSRIYGGIHWQYDNRDALAGGRALADFVYANLLRSTTALPVACETTATTLCLQDRFLVEIDWRTGAAGPVGVGHSRELGTVSGAFSFFNPDNVEIIVKVIEGCSVNGNWWVFGASATNVEYILRITDTHTAFTRTYFNPLDSIGRALTAVDAFPCE